MSIVPVESNGEIRPPALRSPQYGAQQTHTIEELKYMSQAFAASGFFKDAREAAQTFTKMLAGQEFGLGPMASMTGIYIVKERPTLSANTVGAIIKKSGMYDYRVKFLTERVTIANKEVEQVYGCTITFLDVRFRETLGESTFTHADAVTAGLNSGDNYKKFARNMYFARALTNGARWFCPEVFAGAIYTPDEMDEALVLNVAGEPINYTAPRPIDAPALETATPEIRKPMNNKQLVERFEIARAALPDGMQKFGAWADTTIAKGLATRIDPVTNRNAGLTTEERFAAEDAMNALIFERLPDAAAKLKLVAPAPIAPLVAEPAQKLEPADPFDSMPDVDEAPLGIDETVEQHQQERDDAPYAPPGSDAHRALMAKFGEKADVIAEYFPEIEGDNAKAKDARRKEFTQNILQNGGSSSKLTYGQYQKLMKCLDQLGSVEA